MGYCGFVDADIFVHRPISGQVIIHKGWRYAFKMFSISAALLFILQFFFGTSSPCKTRHRISILILLLCPVPETTYIRKQPNTRKGQTVSSSKDGSTEKVDSDKQVEEAREEALSIPRKKTYIEELAVYNGVFPTKASVPALLMRPFIACLTPVCLWAGLIYGVAITWLVLIATSVAQLFSAPRTFFEYSSSPVVLTEDCFWVAYNFETDEIGLTYSASHVILSYLVMLTVFDSVSVHLRLPRRPPLRSLDRLRRQAFQSLEPR